MMDRRSRRSQDPAEALNLFLEASRKRLGVGALTLSLPDGSVVAGAGAHVESVAAMGSWVDRDPDCPPRIAARVATWRLRFDNTDLLLTSHGGRLSADLGEGVRRILGRRVG